MSMWKKVTALACGVSAVGALSLALAQGTQPDPRVANPATGAGQQGPFHTGMGETGLPPWNRQIPVAVIAREPEPVAVAPAPEPAPAPAPAPVAAAPEPEPAPTQMGAPPEPAARPDRN